MHDGIHQGELIDQTVTQPAGGRRVFLKSLGGGVLGAATAVAGIGGSAAAEPYPAPLWDSALVLIGQSLTEQPPNSFIRCPLFFSNGHFANAFHTLDLSTLQMNGKVRGTITFQNQTVEPDFSASVAAASTQGSDGVAYLLVGGEGNIVGGTGVFRGVKRAIVRCKYKIAVGSPLLIACKDCVVILVRNFDGRA
jgi:hypothetical protein